MLMNMTPEKVVIMAWMAAIVVGISMYKKYTEAACDAIENAINAFGVAETQLEAGWDAVADTIHDVLMGFVDLARAREAGLEERASDVEAHVESVASTPTLL